MLFLFLACAPAHDVPAAPALSNAPMMAEIVRLHMSEHLSRALSASHAVVEGDLDQARADLTWTASHVEPEPVVSLGKDAVEALHAAARTGLQGSTVGDYGLAVGQMGAACAGCHVQSAAGLSPIVASKPDGGAGHAAESSWMVGALWTGLVANADSSWTAGAGGLAASPTDAAGYGVATAGPAASAALATLAEQAKAAPTATDRATRAVVYGKIIGACGACHIESRAAK